MYTRHNQLQQEKGKNPVVDEDGFQHVTSKRNTRRNIFEKENALGRLNQTTYGQPGEHSRARDEELVAAEDLETPAEPLGG